MTTSLLQTADGREWTVLGGTIVFPLRGVWTARIELDADSDDPLPSGAATLLLAADSDGDGNPGEPVELIGTIRPEDVATFEGRAMALLVGGEGKLATVELVARTYQQAPFDVDAISIAVDAIGEAGEFFDDDTSHLPSSFVVTRWHRAGGATAAMLLDRLAERFGIGWRVSDDGLVSMGADQWSAAPIEDAAFFVEGPEDAINRTLEGSVGRASIRPGTTLEDGRRIEEAIYTLDGDGLHVMLRWGPGLGAGGLRGDFDVQARRALPRLAYRELHPAVVRRQNPNGTLDLEADDPAIGGITAVPYRPGIVGCRLVIREGERIRIGFEGGDETKPFAIGLDNDPNASKGVARVSDPVDVGVMSIAALAHPSGAIASLTITFTPPGGAPTEIAVLPGSPPLDLPLRGTIARGSTEVFLRASLAS